jgi:hypothetical protein
MSRVRHDGVSGSFANPERPRIGYANFFRDGTVTASSEATGHPKELAFDGFTYDAWQSTGGATEWLKVQLPAAQTASYMAVFGDLAGCQLTPQRSTDGASWTNLDGAYTAPDGRPTVWEFADVSDVYWRLLIENATGALSVKAIHVGPMLVLDAGLPTSWMPPTLNEDIAYTNTISEGGQILGRNIVRRGAITDVESRNVDYTFARNEWAALMDVADLYPVFFWWQYLGLGEVMYAAIDSRSAAFSGLDVDAKFKLKGLVR